MDIHYKNGFVQSEDVSQIDSLSFSSTTNGNSSINQIVNTCALPSSRESPCEATRAEDILDDLQIYARM